MRGKRIKHRYRPPDAARQPDQVTVTEHGIQLSAPVTGMFCVCVRRALLLVIQVRSNRRA